MFSFAFVVIFDRLYKGRIGVSQTEASIHLLRLESFNHRLYVTMRANDRVTSTNLSSFLDCRTLLFSMCRQFPTSYKHTSAPNYFLQVRNKFTRRRSLKHNLKTWYQGSKWDAKKVVRVYLSSHCNFIKDKVLVRTLLHVYCYTCVLLCDVWWHYFVKCSMVLFHKNKRSLYFSLTKLR